MMSAEQSASQAQQSVAELLKNYSARLNPKNVPDANALAEKERFIKEGEIERVRTDKIRNDIAIADNEARQLYAQNVFVITVVWLFIVLCLVVADGALFLKKKEIFDLSDNVVIALLGTTTVNVLGLFGFVMKYLFSHKPSER